MDTNNQETGQDVYGIIGELGKCGAGKEVIQIAKEDIEFGIDHDTILWYGESGWGANRIREFSKIVRSTTDKAFICFIKDGKFTAAQMEILLEFHKKEVPLEKLAELMGQEMTPYELRRALSDIYAGMRQLGSQTGGAGFEEIKKQVSSLAENIGKNHEFYESVSEQLKKIGDAREDVDGVRAELSAQIDQKDRMIGDQQDELNKQVRENAKLRAEKEQLAGKVGSLETELSEKINSYAGENTSLSSELAQKKEELEKTKAELEHVRAENIRINGELERIKADTAAAENTQGKNVQMGYRTNTGTPAGAIGKAGSRPERDAGTGGRTERNTGGSDMVQRTAGKEHGIMEDYQTVIHTDGKEIPVTVEHTRRDGFFSALGKKLFGDRKRMRIIKAVAAAGLDKGQMKQVRNAIHAGLLENEIIDIINSGFDAEEMEQAVEIVLAEKSY